MDYKKLVDTAILAGEIMLKSNAETYRVEDVMNRILGISCLETSEAMVLTTGLFVTLDDPSITPITEVKRIRNRDTNLNNIDKVNSVTRKLTHGYLTLDEAFNELKKTEEAQYKPFIKGLGTSFFALFFTLLFGGGIFEALVAWINGGILVTTSKLERRINLGFFIHNVLYSLIAVLVILIFSRFVFSDFNVNVTITGTIMPLVPGTAITNAFRDTLRGDYLTGGARILESIVIALSIAVGVALGLVIGGVIR
ncbi:threonine/serine exporter family protein [Tissierella creatinini]|nr:threonine/serine exporter family protein [Tissierella creatinini]TJX67539.1 threonine/serine exporter family protein [Soehngenia saccharolytica]